jgi:hypothetical protein
MKTILRATGSFLAGVRRDLSRRHAFAHERVGFVGVRAAAAGERLVLIADTYHPVADGEYLDDKTVGAVINQEAMRKALEIALLRGTGMFHIHMHTFPSRLWFSKIDLDEQRKFVPDFFKVRPEMPHGAVVLSPENATGRVWLSPKSVVPLAEIHVVGSPMRITWPAKDGSTSFTHDH